MCIFTIEIAGGLGLGCFCSRNEPEQNRFAIGRWMHPCAGLCIDRRVHSTIGALSVGATEPVTNKASCIRNKRRLREIDKDCRGGEAKEEKKKKKRERLPSSRRNSENKLVFNRRLNLSFSFK